MDGETVTIPQEEYKQLKRDAKRLRHLEGAGVDNWEGFTDALETEAADPED